MVSVGNLACDVSFNESFTQNGRTRFILLPQLIERSRQNRVGRLTRIKWVSPILYRTPFLSYKHERPKKIIIPLPQAIPVG
jgi:hypothetical protein